MGLFEMLITCTSFIRSWWNCEKKFNSQNLRIEQLRVFLYYTQRRDMKKQEDRASKYFYRNKRNTCVRVESHARSTRIINGMLSTFLSSNGIKASVQYSVEPLHKLALRIFLSMCTKRTRRPKLCTALEIRCSFHTCNRIVIIAVSTFR